MQLSVSQNLKVLSSEYAYLIKHSRKRILVEQEETTKGLQRL